VVEIIKKFNTRTTVGMAAFLISGSYLASRFLGLFRDRLLIAEFGRGPLTDAYIAAFRLPELLFTLLVSGAFAVAFIPILTEFWVKDQRDEAWEVSSTVLNILAIVTLVAGAIVFVFADPLTTILTPGFDADRHGLTVGLTRIMIFTPMFFAISSVFGSIQQSFNRFFFFAIASIFYNFGIIFGILVLSGSYSIYGVAVGVVLGAALQAAVQALGLYGLGFKYKPVLKWRDKRVLRVFKLLVPRSINQGIDQVYFTIQTVIGSQLSAGSLTAFYFANNLKNVPLMIIGNSIATAAFPKMAARAADKDPQRMVEDLVINARMILFLVIPAASLAVILRGYIIRLLFGFGDPTTANVLGWFAGAIVFHSLFFLVSRAYYALQDTRTPLYVGIVAAGVNVILSILLSEHYGVVGLAMATSIIAVLETSILLAILKQRLGTIGGRAILRGVSKMLIANTVMSSAVYILVARVLPLYAVDQGFMIIAPKFAALVIAAGLLYLIPSYVFHLKEARQVVTRLFAYMRRPVNLD
jgi:putative peptidoglycan lipid II flippase